MNIDEAHSRLVSNVKSSYSTVCSENIEYCTTGLLYDGTSSDYNFNNSAVIGL